jgi:hypothetical protein
MLDDLRRLRLQEFIPLRAFTLADSRAQAQLFLE